jgi:hypothetical protein
MSWTHVPEPPHSDLGGYDDGRRRSAVADPFTAERAWPRQQTKAPRDKNESSQDDFRRLTSLPYRCEREGSPV